MYTTGGEFTIRAYLKNGRWWAKFLVNNARMAIREGANSKGQTAEIYNRGSFIS